MDRIRIQRVSPEQVQKVIRQYAPYGCFLTREDGKWIAVDNSTGNAWTEEFRWKRAAVRWLHGALEVYQ